MTEYLRFELDVRAGMGRKTDVWNVVAMRDDLRLGVVKWFARWRQYTFFPDPKATFNPDCLRKVAEFCEVETRKRRG